MDPYYSYYRDHAPYPYYPPPGWEAAHQRMAMDSSCRPPSYGPWPYSGSTSQSRLPESHSCCNHTYPPGYYNFRPTFPQELPPPHLYYHGPFPHHPNAYPPYFVPPPPYPVDQTPYGYEKFKSHCCGCPNHVCHGGEKSNLKIEEEIPIVKPESEQKGADNSSIIRHPNYQYPVMWLPSGNMKDEVNGRSSELPPQLFNKWFPESGERTGDVKQQGHDNQKLRPFQWPIIWMPAGYDEPKQETKEFKEIDQSQKVTEEAPHSPKVKIIPLSWFENDHHDQKPAARDGCGEHNGKSSMTNQSAGAEHRHDTKVDGNFKTIPVVLKERKNENKLVGQNCKAISVVPDKEGDEMKVRTCRTIPVMAQKESDEKKSNLGENKEEKKGSNVEKEGENRKSNNVETSKAKLSKLPPVCLRVDPLPRKKSGNRSSRSPNPATRKVCEKDKGMKETQSKNQERKLSEQNKEINVSVKEKSSDEMDKRIGSRNVTVQDASVNHAQEEQISTSMVDQKVQPSVNAEAQEHASAKSLQECDKSTEDEMKIQGEAANFAREINLSESDAAICIQSAYRGYHVRRWQPLEKLRKIKNVHEQMQDVKKQLQGLEASSKQMTVKEQVAINETIMNLLLNLDTIQGLHPSVREARKYVARQLVCLQGKLDSLCKQLSAEPNHPKSEEEKYVGVDEEQWPSSINSKESMHDDISSGVSVELRQDGYSTEQKHQMEESSTTKEEANDEGKAAAPGECQGAPLMDVMHDAALSGHSTEQKHQTEEPNTILREEWPEEEKAAAKGEGSSAHFMEPLHDPSLSEGSVLKQCTASAEHNCHTEESNTGVSPAATEDSTTAMATASMESEVAVDNDGSVEGQVWESASVDNSELKHDAPAEEDQCKEPSVPFVNLEDSSVSLKDAEPRENDPALADDSVVINPGDQPEESSDANMQKQVADAALDSAKEPDGTPEPPVGDTNNMDYVTTANAENSTQEQIVLVESEPTKQCAVSSKDDSALVDQQNEPHVEKGSAIGEEPEAVPLESEAKTMKNTLNVAGALSNMCAEPTLPESVSSELPCEYDGARVHESPDSKVSSESQSNAQKEADGGKVSASEAVECNEMLEKDPICATGVNSAVVGAANPNEDTGVQIASEEAATVSATHDGVKNDDEKKLAEENQKLKEMLQKLLASGNDQMGVIAELSEKVKTLERKLARKKSPKVRVHRPVRKATANVH